MADNDALLAKFSKLSLEDKTVKDIVKNNKLAQSLSEIVEQTGDAVVPAKGGALLQHLANKTRTTTDEATKARRKLVVDGIIDERLKRTNQIDAAWKYVSDLATAPSVEELNKASGVGVEVTTEQIGASVDKVLTDNKAELEEKRYGFVPGVLKIVKEVPEMQWAEAGEIKKVVDEKVLVVLGPRDERDNAKNKKKAKAPKDDKKASSDKKDDKEVSVRSMFGEGWLAALHKPGENPQAYDEKMKEHLEFTKGNVFTRFPPEPNGYLHIGHSKAITVNFGYAKYHKGKCYLRYDDTNPKAEDDVYVKSIKDIIEWLGFEPYKITYSSDYFDELYALAEKLVNKGLAYVCYCTAEQVKAGRGQLPDGTMGGERKACEHRSYSPEKVLEEFRNMKNGKYNPGEVTLRMKQDLNNPNPAMWDVVAYRVLNEPHHRTGTKWKIYPTYEFTHCLVDSLENISHSLCTLEFRTAREAYEWLCDAVEVYRPAQREYGRLNVTGTIMSKRKIMKLVNEGIVRDWDDPRLFTLVAIRRRGVPPGAILSFVAELGVTTSHTFIQAVKFENSIRKYLENHTPRLMMVPDPVVVQLDNVPDDFCEMINVPFKPGNAGMGEHTLALTKWLYIDRSDFREEGASKEYFRLAPGQPVGLLKVPCTIRYVACEKDAEGKITKIHAHYENDVDFKRPKTYIQWVSHAPEHNSPVKLKEVRLFNQLFKSDNPESNEGGFLADINPDSEQVLTNAVVEPGIFEVKRRSPWTVPGSEDDQEFKGKEEPGSPESIRFQALRVGYFCLDKDSTEDEWVLNRIVTLKEDSAKNA